MLASMSSFLSSLGAAARSMNRSPQVTALAVITLAVGMGAATAIFSVVNATFLTPLPFHEPERLMLLRGYAHTEEGPAVRGASYAEIRSWRERSTSFTDVGGLDGTTLTVGGEHGAEQIGAEIVDGAYFSIVGVRPVAGRLFGPSASDPADPQALAVVSEDFARQRFAGPGQALDRSLTINGIDHRIIGVLPRGFDGVSLNSDIWVPASMGWQLGAWPGDAQNRGSRWMGAVARLRDGVSVEQAQSDMDAVAAQLAERYPDTNTDRSLFVSPVRTIYTQGADITVFLLSGAVGLLLLIACANTANLLLFRAATRSRELLIRVAVGARRRHLFQQIIAETLYISLLAAVTGAVFAASALIIFGELMPAGALPPYARLGFDGWVFAFAVVVTLVTTVLAGLAPAVEASRSTAAEGIAINTRSSVSAGGHGLRRGLVILQSAMALVLMVATLLVTRSMHEQLQVTLGFEPDSRIAFQLNLTDQAYETDEIAPFVRRLQERLAEIPGVRAAAIGSDLPLASGYSASILRIPGQDAGIRYYRHHITSNYLQTLGIELLSGRELGPEAEAGADVVMVSRSFARRYFGQEDVVGEYLTFYPDIQAAIVGVVEDVRFRDLTSDIVGGEDDPDVYMHLLSVPRRDLDVVVETDLGAAEITPRLRAAVAELDPALPVYGIGSLSDAVAAQTAQARLGAALMMSFSGAALLLVAVGLFGVLGAMVRERSRELAVRKAVGATAYRVQSMIMGDGLRLVLTGVILGSIFAFAVERWLSATLYGIGTTGLVMMLSAVGVLLVIAVLGILVPARRAARVDPNQVLGEG